VRAALVSTLATAQELGAPVLPALAVVATEDPSPLVRAKAAHELASIGSPESFEPLAAGLRSGSEKDETVLRALLDAVARCGGEAAESVVAARLAGPPPSVARAAERALVLCGPRGVEKAEAAAAAALAANPSDIDALLQKARIAARTGNEEEARSYLLRAETTLLSAATPRSLYDYRVADDPDYRVDDDPLIGPFVERNNGE